ncbi:MAG: hypothetical protein GY754_20870 [bacterium]|nr:hypothetical protein [bacterium]
MIIIGILALFVSFTIHIYFLIRYVSERDERHLRLFIVTAGLNMLIAAILAGMSMYNPELVHEIDIKLLTWLISGVVMLIMLFVKITIFRNIYKRAQQPEHYHLNFFGKKVLHATVVKPVEVLTFFVTIPLFCLLGAYFVARLINLFLYARLSLV